MSEPKKETVRIVLPPRREGQSLASTPRETAMINLPPKPLAASQDAPAPPPSAPAVPTPPSAPAPPAGLQPPSAPGIPKPPSFPGAPKPPGVPPGAPAAPKPVAPPSASKPPGEIKPPQPIGPTPVAVRPEAKKETAKVASGIAVKPQATVRLQPRPQPSQTASASFKIQSAEAVPATESNEEVPMYLSIAAFVTALIALAFQLWIMAA